MSIEAMKMALEALEEPKEHLAKHRRLEAITALRQAIEQENVASIDTSQERVDEMQKQKHEQQPVIWRSWNDRDGFGFWDTQAEANSHCAVDCDAEPLYTSPPPREWVGLTAKDLAEIPARCYEGAIWADQKIREKNT